MSDANDMSEDFKPVLEAKGTFEAVPSDYLKEQLAEVEWIYKVAFPHHAIEAHLWWEKSPLPTPVVFDQHDGYNASAFDEQYIGWQRLGKMDSPLVKRLDVTIPSAEQTRNGPIEYRPRKWDEAAASYKALHRLSPLLAEDAAFALERRDRNRLKSKHSYKRLSYSPQQIGNSTLKRDDKKDPAIMIGFHWLAVGGAESLAFDTVKWALEAGLRVIVVIDAKGPQPLIGALPQTDRVMVIRTDHYLAKNAASAFFPRLIAQENIVALHNHHAPILYESMPAIRMHFPDMIAIDSTHIIENDGGGYPRISGVWSNYYDHHHVISNDLKDFYRENFRVHKKAVLGRLLDGSTRGQALPDARLRAGQTSVRVAFVGRMVHQKRPRLVAEAFRKMHRWGKRNGVTFHFDMVGDGPQLEAVEGMIRRAGLLEAVTLHAPGADVRAILEQSDVLLLLSANEGLTLVAYEAIEAGCIPISTDVGAQKELIPEALLVPWSTRASVKGALRAVQKLLKHKGFAEDMQRELHAKYKAIADDPTAKEVLSEIYANMLKNANAS